MKLVLLAIGLLLLMAMSATVQQSPADLVILHGHVWTVDHAHPQAEAVGVNGNKIVAVGSEA